MDYTNELLLPKGEKLQFVESFNSLAKEEDKKEPIQNFPWFIINPLSLVSCWQQRQGCWGRNLLTCTQAGIALKKKRWLEENLINF